MDDVCLWEEKSNKPIWHSLWSQAVITGCLSKLAAGSLHRVIIHASTMSFDPNLDSYSHSLPLPQYMDEMIENLRKSPEFLSAESDFDEELKFPEGLDEHFCRFALQMYSTWPPLRANNPRYIDRNKPLIKLPETREEDETKYDAIVAEFQKWPIPPKIPETDLKRMEPIRPVNPLYDLCNGYVFPFLDMGPKNIAVFCFDTKKIAREIMVPQLGTIENRVVAALQRKLSEFERKGRENGIENAVKLFSEVLLKSRKMQSIRKMLTSKKFNAAEIRLQLDACEADLNMEKRERRPTTRFDA